MSTNTYFPLGKRPIYKTAAADLNIPDKTIDSFAFQGPYRSSEFGSMNPETSINLMSLQFSIKKINPYNFCKKEA